MSLLSLEDRRALIALARRAISLAVIDKKIPDISTLAENLRIEAGAFVTLRRDGRLRGCVGVVDDPGPLGETVIRAAVSAALHDSRFSPVGPEEVDHLEIEISVLSTPQPSNLESIILGTHGLMIVNGGRRGLLLPQVATEHRFSSQRFLEETCRKAGLASDAWKDPETRILTFTAEIFSEADAQVST